MHPLVAFIFKVISLTLVQLVGVLGVFFACGFVLSILQHNIHKAYKRLFGWYGILWTAWLGTPVHELSHVLFAKLFRHRIHSVKLFKPNKKSGALGHVDHSFDSRSLYQRIGNFFVGSAPLIGGSAVLYALLRWLLPGGYTVLDSLPTALHWPQSLAATGDAMQTLVALFDVRDWRTWVFVYLSLAISSHLAPSPADRHNMWEGLGYIAGTLLVVNIIASLFKQDITAYVLATNRYLHIVIVMFVWALVLSAVHAVAINLLRILTRR